MADLKYQRILLKVSGEGLCGSGGGLGAREIDALAEQIHQLRQMGVQPAVVVGGGNLVRGERLSSQISIHRVTADQMGMLATVINALALQDVLEEKGSPTRVLSAIGVADFCESFIRRRAIRHLEKGRVVILAGGTGNPFCTTDTCASLRATELQAEVLIKATKVDGVYSADPVKDPTAKLYDKLTYDQVLRDNLAVMDQSAITMCRDNDIDIIVCNLMTEGNVARIARGETVGTMIST